MTGIRWRTPIRGPPRDAARKTAPEKRRSRERRGARRKAASAPARTGRRLGRDVAEEVGQTSRLRLPEDEEGREGIAPESRVDSGNPRHEVRVALREPVDRQECREEPFLARGPGTEEKGQEGDREERKAERDEGEAPRGPRVA
jgi:hypothetical protein